MSRLQFAAINTKKLQNEYDSCNNLSEKTSEELENLYKLKGCNKFWKTNTDCCTNIANTRRSKKQGIKTADFFKDNVEISDDDIKFINDNRKCKIADFPPGFIDKLSQFGVEYKYKQCCIGLFGDYGRGCQSLRSKNFDFEKERNKDVRTFKTMTSGNYFNTDNEILEQFENLPERPTSGGRYKRKTRNVRKSKRVRKSKKARKSKRTTKY